jgi:dipeptidyl-peptidase 4
VIRRLIAPLVILAFVLCVVPTPRAAAPPARAPHTPTMAQFMSPAFPLELVAAKRADRIAWIANDKGRRNVYTAAAPAFRPVRVTQYLDDDGVDLSQLAISNDGATVVFVRGHTPNREGWIADPAADPRGVERAIWAARTAGGPSWRLAEGSNPELSPDGRWVAYAKDGFIHRVPVAQAPPTSAIDKGEKPLIRIWGTNANPVWSPDGTKLAFISGRTDHSFVAIYDARTKKITYLSPSVDWDTSPAWSPDSRRVAFIRRPGTPFALQAQPGVGGLGNPPGPAFNPNNPQGRGGVGRGGGRGLFGPPQTQSEQQGRGGRESGPPPAPRPGLNVATFSGGYNLSFWVGDASTGEAREFWHNAPEDKTFTNINAISWAGDRVVFQIEPEEWTRFYSIKVDGPSDPISLTPQEGQIETIAFSNDGQYLYYGTNARDIERRHIWRVPVAGGEPVPITKGDGIEHDPVVLASGSTLAVLSADAKRPQSVGIVAASSGEQKVIFPALPKEFPIADEVVPDVVMTKAADGLAIHNQLFLPKDLRPGDKRPAIIFVHGGPIRQMLVGYHYMEVYHLFYAVNQWLTTQGYIVMSVNYRGGIGYGKSFRTAPNTNARGNSEYQDVVAGAKYLQSRPDVDPKRIGIWGLSYGGLLTAQALARNSDMFAAGIDLAGVHLYGSSLDPENLAYQSSAISAIDKWKSPVLLLQGDDDRNVNFAQTVGLVDLLRAHDVPYELIVFPDDVHETLLYKRWLYTFDRFEDFLNRHLGGAPVLTNSGR